MEKIIQVNVNKIVSY